MNIHEYQAKEIFEKFGVPTPNSGVASTAEEAIEIADRIGGRVVVKAQVHAGGRGKAGGVKLVESSKQAGQLTEELIGTHLVTNQTGPTGVPIEKVMIAETLDIKDELYLSIVIDGDLGAPVVMASSEGGMDIEEVAATTPEKIFRVIADPLIGLSPYHARDLAIALEVPSESIRATTKLIIDLYKVFIENDCSLVEVNPLVVTKDNAIVALDAKINLEDDALFRHPELANLIDPNQLDPLEQRAYKSDLAYVKLSGGRVGCMVNGAGLAMATMDITKNAGADPANFLDIGGSANQERIEEAFKIIVDDTDVEIVLVNLFAGIARSDVVAAGIVAAAAETAAKMPLVVSMRGTNAKEGIEILTDSDLDITVVTDLAGAADVLQQKLLELERSN
ncbi:MAG: ADP-forming succinate--CoA ligase subunit beta [SAR202 cluster bacterium]|nr:MAG: ADP-forming succinate--CoA ligase subunit beta [SAR202 cluster bacterium]KAA1302234.1 MAG: ADP-forming succinate--CoA ligase subunit beta [SAR202 cluster bacterium]MCH2529515.1 ADP-forming succinate--CoA ligase subunit beta [Dehalococcoidia bacterium]GIT17297.1 MAG: succinate--CoA ligase [ADP-forming] subunit beta [Dehalococcoidia bacterium]GIT58321.1 MAG: succinate--CoA ligase [ADP-forming] subunit beta [Dehalococcoidia bacterium]